jgi:3-deoxy-D-manno-octulosonic-acid transferase
MGLRDMMDRAIWFVYNILFAVGYTLLMPKFLLRMRRRGGYRQGFLQRFGRYDAAVVAKLKSRPRIWVHAVSVGEVFVALHYMAVLREAFPRVGFVLTTTTSTGYTQARSRVSEDDVLLYFPADFPMISRSVVRQIRPVAVLLTECELWPNLLRRLNRENVPVFVINGRISESSFRGYRKVRPFFRRAVQWVDTLFVQAEVDRERLMTLGTPEDRVIVMGSAKYDVAQPDDEGAAVARRILAAAGMVSEAEILIGGSTWPGEEDVLLGIFSRLREHHPRLQLILVPRHMERRDEVEALLRESGLPYVKRTDMIGKAEIGKQKAEIGKQKAEIGKQKAEIGKQKAEIGKQKAEIGNEELIGSGRGSASEAPCVLLADTTGELKHYYQIGSVVFVGKSLGDNEGGQNPIEPAMCGKPIVVGPHMENFPGVIHDFLDAEALIQVADDAELEAQLSLLLGDAAMRDAYGARAGALVERKRGVVARTVERIRERVDIP